MRYPDRLVHAALEPALRRPLRKARDLTAELPAEA